MEWITDRLPTVTDSVNGYVWVYAEDVQHSFIVEYDDVSDGTPWQHIQEPEDYNRSTRYMPFLVNGQWKILDKKTGVMFLTIETYGKAYKVCSALNQDHDI